MLDTGISYRQLDYWTSTGWLVSEHGSPGSGYQRWWPAHEAEVARVMALLVSVGIKSGVAEAAARNGGQLAPGVWVVDERGRPICVTPRPPEGGGAS